MPELNLDTFMQSRAAPQNNEKRSAVQKWQGRVAGLDGRQPACVLRLALRDEGTELRLLHRSERREVAVYPGDVSGRQVHGVQLRGVPEKSIGGKYSNPIK